MSTFRHPTEANLLSVYADTDSIKQQVNAYYGKVVMNMAITDYIVVHRAHKSIVLFKKFIIGVEQDDDGEAIIYTVGQTHYVDEKYADVIKRLI